MPAKKDSPVALVFKVAAKTNVWLPESDYVDRSVGKILNTVISPRSNWAPVRTRQVELCDTWQVSNGTPSCVNPGIRTFDTSGTNNAFSGDYSMDQGTSKYINPIFEGLNNRSTMLGFSGAGASGAGGTGGGVVFYTDSIPQLGTDLQDPYSAPLATIVVNNQQFAVPMPQPCFNYKNPANFANEVTECLAYGGPIKVRQRYEKYRAWLLNPTDRTNASSTWTAGNNAPGWPLLDQTVTSGINAGLRVKVTLVDARYGNDTTGLTNDGARTYSLKPELSTSVKPDNWKGYDAGRWRFRYKIEFYGFYGAEFHPYFEFANNTLINLGLNNSSGVSNQENPTGDLSQLVAIQGKSDTNPATWKNLCIPGYSTDSGQLQRVYPTGANCEWLYANKGMSSPNEFRFAVVNGYVNPTATIGGSSATLDKTNTDGFVHFSNAVPTSYTAKVPYGGSTQTYYANTVVPIEVKAEPMAFNAVYYADADNALQDSNFPVQNLNVATNSKFTIPLKIPALKAGAVFHGWDLYAYNDNAEAGKKLTLVKQGLSGGSVVDIANLRDANGKRLLSSITGEPLLTELRLVANISEDAFSKTPAYFPVAKTLRDTSESSETLFSYRAVPGMTAMLDPSYLASVEQNIKAGQPARTYTLQANRTVATDDTKSDYGPLTLSLAGDSRRLTLLYTLKAVTTGFDKSFADDARTALGLGDLGLPSADKFKLRLVNTKDASDVVEISNGQTGDLSQGTYKISEVVVGDDRNSSITKKFRPYDVPDDNTGIPFVCKVPSKPLVTNAVQKAADGSYVLNVLDVPNMTCTVKNTATVVSMTAWNGNSYFTDANLKLPLTPSDATNSWKAAAFTAKADYSNSSGYLTPGEVYTVAYDDSNTSNKVQDIQIWNKSAAEYLANTNNARNNAANWTSFPAVTAGQDTSSMTIFKDASGYHFRTLGGNNNVILRAVTKQMAKVRFIASMSNNFGPTSPAPDASYFGLRLTGPGEASDNTYLANSTNNGNITPNATYTMSMSRQVPGRVFLGFERYVGTVDKTTNNDVDGETKEKINNIDPNEWQAFDAASGFSVAGGERLIVRAVYITPTAPDLPLTGGSAADWFYIIGLGGLGAGLLAAAAKKRLARD